MLVIFINVLYLLAPPPGATNTRTNSLQTIFSIYCIGDSLGLHNGMKFSTKDQDNDNNSHAACALAYFGAWWYNLCLQSNLNGKYLGGNHASYADGIEWWSWTGFYYSLKSTKMMIRRQWEKLFKDTTKNGFYIERWKLDSWWDSDVIYIIDTKLTTNYYFLKHSSNHICGVSPGVRTLVRVNSKTTKLIFVASLLSKE